MSYMKNLTTPSNPTLADMIYAHMAETNAVHSDSVRIKTLTVEVREQYGVEAIYPVSRGAFVFAQIAGTKTLTRRTIALIKQLGYTIDVQQKEVKL